MNRPFIGLTRKMGLAAAAAAVTLTGCAGTVPVPTFAPTPAASLATPMTGGALAGERGDAAGLLAALPVKGRAPRAGYDRDEFPHWTDPDGNGCDARADTLARDATPGRVTRDRRGCAVGAVIDDPYTGTPVTEQTGPGSDVDIDHVVSLSDAWQKGAQQWTRERREQFANDPTNLLAVDDAANQAKGDGDAATWLPPHRPYRCDYVVRQVQVKAAYRLWVAQAERDAIARVLATCPDGAP